MKAEGKVLHADMGDGKIYLEVTTELEQDILAHLEELNLLCFMEDAIKRHLRHSKPA